MDAKGKMARPPVFVLFFVPLFLIACTTPSWFPFQKGPPHKAKGKELVDKEVIVIDKREYVKVSNPRASELGQPKILYVPVDDYLAQKQSFTPLTASQRQPQKDADSSPVSSSPVLAEKVTPVAVTPVVSAAGLKKKVLIPHFDDRTSSGEEVLGEWVTDRLIKEVQRRTQRVLFVDYEGVKEFLVKKGLSPADLETPNVLRELNEVFGIHAVVVGRLAGPYVFVSKGTKEPDTSATAVVQVDMKVVEALTGNTVKGLTASNPVVASKEKGSFSEEKAKLKAIDLTLTNLSVSLSRVLESLDWFCRVAKVEDRDVYINAGRTTGLKIGDVVEVFRPAEGGAKEESKGRVRISSYFGLDASTGRTISGSEPDVNDILRLTKGGGG